ncbi:MAG: adenylate/guanylate cyclase domain-containing protein [Nitrospirae bacterium]|nr:MAG: adenylate/guanylate cyclase domain-containing protein [Nitrospirota bacterium]
MTDYFVEIQNQSAKLATHKLAPGKRYVVGRSKTADLPVEGDPYISREHVEVCVESDQLVVSRRSLATNPIVFKGAPTSACVLKAGDEVTIGQSILRFKKVVQEAPPKPDLTMSIRKVERTPSNSHALKSEELYELAGDAGRHQFLFLLELPELMKSRPRQEVLTHVAKVLRTTTKAHWATVLTTSPEGFQVLAEDVDEARRKGVAHPVSGTLVESAIRDAPRPVLYFWDKSADASPQATSILGIDWAIAAAAYDAEGEPPIVFYVAGEASNYIGEKGGQKESARFVGLVVDIIARNLALDVLREKQLRLGHFFSPRICARLLEGKEQADLQPRIAESTVLFFDIRDFSKRTQGAVENLLAYQGELRSVMTAMTEAIFEENGVVIQYMGDGIMAAWNVPVEDQLHVDCACRAALKMASRIGQVAEGWRCGIGLDVGNVVAGAMGSDQVYSYGIMGPVVNQASRIEGITKVVGARILVSAAVAKRVSAKIGLSRRVGRFQPAGFTIPVDLYELIPPPGDPKEEQEIFANITLTNQGLEAFECGEWEKAAKCFKKLPDDDNPASFLLYLAMDYQRRPPRDWHGVIELKEK